MYESDQKLSKLEVEVLVQLNDGTQFLGFLAVKQQQRISDLLNDDRQFIPVQTTGGSVSILSKAAILKVAPLDQPIDRNNVTDPYEILGARRSFTDKEMREHYLKLCSENHPDRVQAAGLSAQFAEIANSRMVRINDAYDRIRKMRGEDDDFCLDCDDLAKTAAAKEAEATKDGPAGDPFRNGNGAGGGDT